MPLSRRPKAPRWPSKKQAVKEQRLRRRAGLRLRLRKSLITLSSSMRVSSAKFLRKSQRFCAWPELFCAKSSRLEDQLLVLWLKNSRRGNSWFQLGSNAANLICTREPRLSLPPRRLRMRPRKPPTPRRRIRSKTEIWISWLLWKVFNER